MKKQAITPSIDLEQQVRSLVKQLQAAGTETRVYVALVKLGLAHKDAVGFRRLLIRAGMWPSRASELKVILEAREVAEAFVAPDGLSVREALEAARASRRRSPSFRSDAANPQSPDSRQRINTALERLLDLLGRDHAWCVACGMFQLRFAPSPNPPTPAAAGVTPT